MPCFWKVRVWDKDGQPSAWSEPLRRGPWDFEADRLAGAVDRRSGDDRLEANGHEGRRAAAGDHASQGVRGSRPDRRATVSVTGLGLYELRINGQRVGDHVLAPEWTRYGKRIKYQTYDVTDLLRDGQNAVAAQSERRLVDRPVDASSRRCRRPGFAC